MFKIQRQEIGGRERARGVGMGEDGAPKQNMSSAKKNHEKNEAVPWYSG